MRDRRDLRHLDDTGAGRIWPSVLAATVAVLATAFALAALAVGGTVGQIVAHLWGWTS